MNNNIKHIKELLDKFMSAQTTEAEEQELSDYFANNKDIPAEWKAYSVLFGSFKTDAYDYDEKYLDEKFESSDEQNIVQLHSSRKILSPIRKIVASIAFFLLLSGLSYAVVRTSFFTRSWNEPIEEVTTEQAPTIDPTNVKAEIKTVGDSIVLFKDVRLDSIMMQMDQHYKVESRFADEETKAIRMLLKWNKRKSLDEVLNLLNGFDRLNVRRESDILIIEQTSK
ncbi:MAG: DUF4974 domain-containing protein [Bacteroidaceae bacterium]|nr:DUF4974 domain-containing protein [Bacteroidaceae bacterium]